MKIIEIIIDSKGNARIESKGFIGNTCRAATAPLERALGIVTSDTPTAQMHQSQAQEHQQRAQNQ
jgi:hypothetical protein